MKKANQRFYNNKENQLFGFDTPETVDCIRKKIVDKLKCLIDQKLCQYSNVCLIQFGFGNGYLIQDLLNFYSNYSTFNIIGVDYTDDKARLIKDKFSKFKFYKCDVEDRDQLSAFIKKFNNTIPSNVFTIGLMLELIDDLTTTFYKKSDDGTIYELYCNEDLNQKPLFKYISDSFDWFLGNNLIQPKMNRDNLWHKLTFEEKSTINCNVLVDDLSKGDINSEFFMPYHLHTRQILKSLSNISSDQSLIVIDYFKPLSNISPVRVYPRCEGNDKIECALLLIFLGGIYSTWDSFNKSDYFSGCLKFLSLAFIYKFFKDIEDSSNRGQTVNPHLPFNNKHPIFYECSKQQLTTSVNEGQLKSELADVGYLDTHSEELMKSLQVCHSILSGRDFRCIQSSKYNETNY